MTQLSDYKVTRTGASKNTIAEWSAKYNDLLDFLGGASKYIVDSTATDQGAVSTTGDRTIKDFVDTIENDTATIIIPHSSTSATTTFTLTTSETIPANITLVIEPGAIIDGAGTLTVYSPENVQAGHRQKIFGSSLTVTLTKGGTVYASWWGYSIDATAANNATYLDACITTMNAATGIIRIPAGTYADDGNHTITSNVNIIGDGGGPGSSGAGLGNTIITHDAANYWLTARHNHASFKSCRNNRIKNLNIDLTSTSTGAINLVAPFYNVLEQISITQATPGNGIGIKIETNTDADYLASALYNRFNDVAVYGCAKGFFLVSDTDKSKVVNNNTFTNCKATAGTVGFHVQDVDTTEVASANDNVWIAPEIMGNTAQGFLTDARRAGVIIAGNIETNGGAGVEMNTPAADGSPTLAQLILVGTHVDDNSPDFTVDTGRNLIKIAPFDSGSSFIELGDLDIDKNGNLTTEGFVKSRQGLRTTQYTATGVSGNVDLDSLMGSSYDTAYLYLDDNTTITKFPYDGAEVGGTIFVLSVRQAAAGAKTIAFPANVNIQGGAFTLTAAASRLDVLTFMYLASYGFWAEIARTQNLS